MFCANCGNELADGTKFCTKCGTPVKWRSDRAAAQQSSPAPSVRAAQPVVKRAPTAPKSDAQWHAASTPELGGPSRRIMTNRGLIKYVVFSLLTLGLYSFYFIYMMAQDMNTMCEDDDQKTGGMIAFILLNIVTLGVYGIYWWYKIADRVYLNAPRYGIAVAEKGSSFLLWWLLGLLTIGIASLVGYHAVIRNVNSLAAAYNRTHGFA